jgi:hypothetical protein
MGLDIVELFAEVEQEFTVEIPNDAAATITTVGQLLDYLEQHAPAAREPGAWERLVAVVERESGVDASRIHRGARFVQDLGMD